MGKLDKEDMKILVTGGSGMVGNHLKKILPEDTVYLSSYDYDLKDQNEVNNLFNNYTPDVVIHLAATVGGIIDNIERPGKYIMDNILMDSNIVRGCLDNNIERLIMMSSTCMYPDVVDSYPMKEEDIHKGPPTPTNFSYGYAKRTSAVMIDACNKQYGTKYQYLIPCNLYGEHDKYDDKKSHFVGALIKKIYNAKINNLNEITLMGDGTPLRQFMYAGDLAHVIKHCIDYNITDSFNVSTEEVLSIKEIAYIAIKAANASHLDINFNILPVNGQFRKDVSIEKLKSLIPTFKPTLLEEGISKTFKYYEQYNA